MDRVFKFVRTCRVTVKEIFTTNLDYHLEFKIVEGVFNSLGKFKSLEEKYSKIIGSLYHSLQSNGRKAFGIERL